MLRRFAHGAAHRTDRPAQPLHDVDVVDRVLEQRAATAPSGVDAPVRAVEVLNRDELIVAERHGQQPTRALVGEQRLRMDELGHEPKDQADLVGDTCRLHSRHHPRGRCRVDGERLLAEHGDAALGGGRDEALVLGRPCRDEHRVDPVEELLLRNGIGSDAIGKGPGSIRVEIVYGDDPVLCGRVLQEPAVGAGDEPCADEPETNRHGRGLLSRSSGSRRRGRWREASSSRSSSPGCVATRACRRPSASGACCAGGSRD